MRGSTVSSSWNDAYSAVYLISLSYTGWGLVDRPSVREIGAVHAPVIVHHERHNMTDLEAEKTVYLRRNFY